MSLGDIKLSVQYLKEKNNTCIQVDNIQKNCTVMNKTIYAS